MRLEGTSSLVCGNYAGPTPCITSILCSSIEDHNIRFQNPTDLFSAFPGRKSALHSSSVSASAAREAGSGVQRDPRARGALGAGFRAPARGSRDRQLKRSLPWQTPGFEIGDAAWTVELEPAHSRASRKMQPSNPAQANPSFPPRSWPWRHPVLRLQTGFGEYSVVQTALLDCYSRSASGLESARFLFDEMCDRTIVSWTAMVSGYIRLGKIEEAVVLFEEMPERDVPSWNALIAGCTQNGLFSRALSILRSMIGCSTSEEGQPRGNRPNAITVACALSACGHSGTLQLGKEIHGYILRNELGVDPYLSNALIDMYGKCASLNDAMMIFDKTAKRNLTSWNSMINCLAFHGQTSHAISIFEDMMLSGDDILPDEVTFIGLLNACTHGGEVERGKAYFEAMARDYNLQPCIQHYGCLIDLLGRAGKFEEALEVVRGMKIQPDEVIWGALLNGSRLHGRIDLAEVAVGKLIELDPDNGGYRTMLANIYGEQGKWEEVRRIRKILKEQDSYKTPGCSWVEINSQLHQFYSVDLTHSRTDEIYATLESLVDVC
ncbi:hypothetical protein SAY86_025030 [Trapa natans]|uniref:Pentatricopeptide repeat-containing protein n=1 Tax=Trapa natans TaxID=22666 RepID=A0AAN7M5H5_TRANT|nr:hypothetical protein SAY86_025030 [Trapa natans]